jgi:hypothetical protein
MSTPDSSDNKMIALDKPLLQGFCSRIAEWNNTFFTALSFNPDHTVGKIDICHVSGNNL